MAGPTQRIQRTLAFPLVSFSRTSSITLSACDTAVCSVLADRATAGLFLSTNHAWQLHLGRPRALPLPGLGSMTLVSATISHMMRYAAICTSPVPSSFLRGPILPLRIHLSFLSSLQPSSPTHQPALCALGTVGPRTDASTSTSTSTNPHLAPRSRPIASPAPTVLVPFVHLLYRAHRLPDESSRALCRGQRLSLSRPGRSDIAACLAACASNSHLPTPQYLDLARYQPRDRPT